MSDILKQLDVCNKYMYVSLQNMHSLLSFKLTLHVQLKKLYFPKL